MLQSPEEGVGEGSSGRMIQEPSSREDVGTELGAAPQSGEPEKMGGVGPWVLMDMQIWR